MCIGQSAEQGCLVSKLGMIWGDGEMGRGGRKEGWWAMGRVKVTCMGKAMGRGKALYRDSSMGRAMGWNPFFV